MGRRLDQLNLTDEPVGGDDLGLLRHEAEVTVQKLQAMLDDGRYDFAWGMLQDMQITIRDTGRVTEGQRTAMENVLEGEVRGREKKDRESGRAPRRGGSRRYEGWVGSD